MPDDLPQAPTSPLPPEPAEPLITLDEWIAATQSCCGVDHPDDDESP